jgi:Pyruvate/2-oxoacid:ferredoxin oxidoreductase gamma subunit
MDLNIFICGIGGQGVVFLGSLLRNFFSQKHPKALVLGTESRGVSQREGSVISTVRIHKSEQSKIIMSPEIPPFSADIIIALEPLELLRNFSMVNKHTLIIVNNEPIIPKSSVLWMNDNLNNTNTQNVKNFSQPQWIVNKVIELLESYPSTSTKQNFSPDFINQEGSEIKNMDSFSILPRVMDLNFTSLVLEELGSTTYLNLVMVGFLANIKNARINYIEFKNFIKEKFQEKKQILETNQSALIFGETLAKNYQRLRNFT